MIYRLHILIVSVEGFPASCIVFFQMYKYRIDQMRNFLRYFESIGCIYPLKSYFVFISVYKNCFDMSFAFYVTEEVMDFFYQSLEKKNLQIFYYNPFIMVI